jgi:rubrerythrin
MSDLIKREDAIATIGVMYERCDTYDITDYRDLMLEAVKVLPSVDRPQDDDWEKYSDKLWKNAYERGKEEEHRWWSKHCAKCTDADRPQGEWKRRLVDNGFNADWVCSECGYRVKTDFVSFNYCPYCGAKMKGATDGNQ